MLKNSICTVFLSSVVVAALIGGCTIKVPNSQEQQELSRRGAFPLGAPAWMGGGAVGTGPTMQSGVIPERVALPQPIRDRVDIAEAERDFWQPKKKAAPEQIVVETKQLSPLDRINDVCPELESEVNEALTTTELSDRTSKYQSLAQRCAKSPDLWVWFGQESLKANRTADAKRAFDEALILDNQNAAAKGGLEELSAKLSTGPVAQ